MCAKHNRQKKGLIAKQGSLSLGCHSSHKHWHRNLPKQSERGLEEPQLALLCSPGSQRMCSAHTAPFSRRTPSTSWRSKLPGSATALQEPGVISRDFAEGSQQYPRNGATPREEPRKLNPQPLLFLDQSHHTAVLGAAWDELQELVHIQLPFGKQHLFLVALSGCPGSGNLGKEHELTDELIWGYGATSTGEVRTR